MGSNNASTDKDFAAGVKALLAAYEQQGASRFREFKETWQAMDFTGMHSTHPDPIHPLYYTFLGYLFGSTADDVKIAVIYALYLLYNTQVANPKAKVILTPPLWQAISDVDQRARATHNADCYQIIKKMRKEGIFVFSAALHPAASHAYMPLNSFISCQPERGDVGDESVDNRPTSSGVGLSGDMRSVVEFEKIDNLARAYYIAKAQPSSICDSASVDLSKVLPPPPSLNFVYGGLGDDLRAMVDAHEMKKAQWAAFHTQGFSSNGSTGSLEIVSVQMEGNVSTGGAGGQPTIPTTPQLIPTSPINENNSNTRTPASTNRKKRRRAVRDEESE